MINYKTNDNWFGDIRHLWTSWTMVRIVRSVLAIGLYALIVTELIIYFELEQDMMLNLSVFSLLGVILSILLVFRTNTAYDRWWEGRKQWGALVNHSRNFAIYVDAMFPEEDQNVRRFFAKNISNFCYALVEHLRSGTKVDELIYVKEEEAKILERKAHEPNYISQVLARRLAKAHRAQEINEGDYINIKAQHQALLDILGACERIKKTPIPFSYSVYLKIFITAYGLILPIALVSSFHHLSIPLSMFVFFALLGVELLGEEIEDPFGLDRNDLPTGDIAHTIRNNVFEILEDRTELSRLTPDKELYQKVF